MRRQIIPLPFILLLALMATGVCGQSLTTVASRDSLTVGDTMHLRVTAQAPGGAEIFFSQIPDTLAGQGLLLQALPTLDTLRNESAGISTRLTLPIIALDSGECIIPMIPVLVRYNGKIDTLLSELHRVHVSLMPADSTLGELRPIVPPPKQGYTWAEIWPWLLLALVLVALGVLYYLYRTRWRQEQGSEEAKRELVPPIVMALERLKRIEERGVGGLTKKGYYSELGDTLREYMGRIWELPLLERTTDQTISHLRGCPACRDSWVEEAQRILRECDLVKFARHDPSEDEARAAHSRTESLVRSIHEATHVESTSEESGSVGSGTTNGPTA